jgi:hypothetical protein
MLNSKTRLQPAQPQLLKIENSNLVKPNPDPNLTIFLGLIVK